MIFVIVCAVVLFGSIAAVLLYLTRKKPAYQQPPPGLVYADLLNAIVNVWVDEFGMKYSDLPKLTWVTGSKLNCFTGRGWKNGDECVGGLSFQGRNECQIAWPTGETKFSRTAFVHELRHAKAWITGETSDHFSVEFQADVTKGNARLEAGGL